MRQRRRISIALIAAVYGEVYPGPGRPISIAAMADPQFRAVDTAVRRRVNVTRADAARIAFPLPEPEPRTGSEVQRLPALEQMEAIAFMHWGELRLSPIGLASRRVPVLPSEATMCRR